MKNIFSNLCLPSYFKKIILIFLCSFLIFSFAGATDLTSTNFIIKDPIIGTGGGFGTSTSFKLYSTGNTLLSGVGSSATYIGHYGFLYYPFVTVGTLSALQNGIDADLSWSASTSGQGWTISGYKTGIATVSGGPYTYTSVGNVISYSYEGLTPGEYCFVVQTLDSLGYVIGTSNEDCVTIAPTLVFSLSASSVNLGTLTTSAAGTGSHTISVLTNASSGFALSYLGATLTNSANGLYTIPVYTSGASSPGTAGFGINLKDNTTPDIGANPVSNYGTCGISSGYDTADQYTFVASSTTTLTSVTAPTDCVYTTSYIANISSTTAAGSYTTDITYITTGTF